jgi:hypothetical protein
VEDVSTVSEVRATLLEQVEALRKAREDADVVQVAAAESERELASARAQLQQDCATLEGARSWQSQAEEKAKEAELLRTSLVDKAASTEERLQREQDTRQQMSAQLQQERAASLRLGPPSSVSAWRGKRARANSSKSAPHSRGRRRPSSSGTKKSRGSTGS